VSDTEDGSIGIKGIYGDGDNGLIQSRKQLLPHVPFQLCVFHKELRMESCGNQITHISKKLPISKNMTQDISIFIQGGHLCKSKEESVEALERLGKYVKQEQNPRFDKAYRSLKTNFRIR